MTAADRNQADGPGLNEHSSIGSVQSLYDRWAAVYDWNPVLALVRPARRQTITAMNLAPGDTVVDMGTGTGANLPVLRDAVGPDGKVIGIDVSPAMLRHARRRVEREDWTNVTLVRGDIRDPPLDGPVDGILSTFVVVMYADPGRLIETWVRYLDDGTLANLYSGPSDRWYARAVNALLGLYLRLFEEGWSAADGISSPLQVLARRGQRVREAINRCATSADHEAYLFGLAQVDIARFDSYRSR